MVHWWWIPLSWVLLWTLFCTAAVIYAGTSRYRENRKIRKAVKQMTQEPRET